MFALDIIPITSSILTDSLTYFSKTAVSPGTLVTVPLRNREITGIVLVNNNVRDIKQNLRHQNFTIKHITHIHEQQIFSPAYLQTISLLKKYYLVPIGKLIDVTYPRAILKNLSLFTHTKQNNKNNIEYTETLLQDNYQNRVQTYTQKISEFFRKNKSVHIICPTIHQVKNLYKDLKEKGVEQVYILHGKTSQKKITEAYNETSQNTSVLISTPGFIDVPVFQKSLVIIEQDSSEYYYRTVQPIVDMRILVQEYAKQSYIEIIFADNLLRPLRFMQQPIPDTQIFPDDTLKLVEVHKKQTTKQTDQERVQELTEKSNFSLLSKKILSAIQASVDNHEKVFCYVQKKSLAPILLCKTCGNIAMDTISKKPYSLYIKTNNQTGLKERIFINPTTAEKISAFDLCQFCHTGTLESFGIGTNTVAELLRGEFPNVNVLVCDSFHIKNETELKNLFKKFNSQEQKTILVGTQKAIPYLEHIDTSYIISIDSIFSHMSYTTDFRALYTIKQIEEKTFNHIYIQSRNTLPENLPILKNDNFKSFVKKSLSEAQSYTINPYGTLLKINHICQKRDHHTLIHIYTERLGPWNPHIQIKPSHVKNKMSLEILLHLSVDEWNLYHQNQELSKTLPFGERNIHIEINPEVF